MDKIFLERIKDNRNLFTENEFREIMCNIKIFKKVYLIGFKNGIETNN